MKRTYLLPLLLLGQMASAETAYVTDRMEFNLRSGESVRHKTVKMLASGTEVTVLEKNDATGYAHVRLADGTEGYILTRQLQDGPGNPKLVEQSEQQIAQLQTENAQLKAELQAMQGDGAMQALASERDKLRLELAEIQQAGSNAIQLKQQRDQLQERVVTAERELQQLKRENQALGDSGKQDWFLYGGLLASGGVLLGLLASRLSRPRRHGGWDTF